MMESAMSESKLTTFQARAIVDAVNAMFRGDHFSICVVDQCQAITGAQRTADYESLRLYHCRPFRDMTPETREQIFRATIENVCNVGTFPEIRLACDDPTPAAAVTVRQSFLARLFRSDSFR